MKISELIEELQQVLAKEGDIEVTCTGSSIPDWDRRKHGIPDVYETTVENLVVHDGFAFGERVVRVRL